MILRAPAKLNLCLYLGARRDDGLHELRSLFCPLLLSDRIEVERAPRARPTRSSAPGSRARTWSGSRSRRCGRGAGSGRRCGSRSTSGSRSPPGSAAAAPTPPRCCGWPPASSTTCRGSPPGSGADVPSQLDPAFALVGGAGEMVEPLPAPGEFAVVLIADDDGLATAEVYARGGLARARRARPRSSSELAARLREAAAAGASPLDYAELLVNDLEQAAISLRPAIAEALAALDEVGARARRWSAGSGPTAVGLFDDMVAADAAALGAAAPLRARDRLGAAAPRIIRARVQLRGREARPRSGSGVIVARDRRSASSPSSASAPTSTSSSCSRTSPSGSATGPTCWSGCSRSSRPAPSSA